VLTWQGASAFNQPLSLDTSSVTSMTNMFFNAEAFNQPLSFDTSSITIEGRDTRNGMEYVFEVRLARVLPPMCIWGTPHRALLRRRRHPTTHSGATPPRTIMMAYPNDTVLPPGPHPCPLSMLPL